MTPWFLAIGLLVLAASTATVLLKTPWRVATLAYLNKEQMPIWLSILLAAGAAAGTYWLAPKLNESFEYQKSRSTHLLQTVSDLNKINIELAVAVRKFNDALVHQRKNTDERRGELLDKITEAQWRLIDVTAIIRRADNTNNCVKTLSTKLENLQSAVTNASSPENQDAVVHGAVEVATATRSCMVVLYSAAKLTVT